MGRARGPAGATRGLARALPARARAEVPIESIALPASFTDAPLFRQWSGDGQKLYFWLRARVDRDDPRAPDDYRSLRAAGFLVAYATAEELMARAVDCSRNTLTKLLRELPALGVARCQPARRGYVFTLGERVGATTRGHQPVALEVFYLDQLVAAASPTPDPERLVSTPTNTAS